MKITSTIPNVTLNFKNTVNITHIVKIKEEDSNLKAKFSFQIKDKFKIGCDYKIISFSDNDDTYVELIADITEL